METFNHIKTFSWYGLISFFAIYLLEVQKKSFGQSFKLFLNGLLKSKPQQEQ
jgi:hypothetical protein